MTVAVFPSTSNSTDAKPVFVKRRLSSNSNSVLSIWDVIWESTESDANSSINTPLKGAGETIAYFNVPPLIGVPSWVTSDANFIFGCGLALVVVASLDCPFPPQAANVTATAAVDKNNRPFFFIKSSK